MNVCSVCGCGKPRVARGWCHAHYKKWRLHGSPDHGTTYVRARGTGTVNRGGYVQVGIGRTKRMQHVLAAEAVLGKALPAGAVVHHVDHNRANNTNSNLVVCQDQTYHQLLHARERALIACGNPCWRMCCFCKVYCDTASMSETGAGSTSGRKYYHKGCKSEYERKRTIK